MSRSRKKSLYTKQPNDQAYKKYANRVVRHTPIDVEIPDGKAYRKLWCSYDISDWCWFEASDWNSYYRDHKKPLKWINRILTDDEIAESYRKLRQK